MGKRESIKRITSSWAGRTLATGRAAAHLGRAAASHAVHLATDATDARLGEALVEELDGMKGLAMKVGQMASYLEGSVPPTAQRVLRKLQQGGDPVELAALLPVLQAALGSPVGELFEDFDPVPLASASIAQVHRATLDGRPVAVKIQYPEIAGTFEIDLGHLKRIAALAGLGSAFDAREIVGELRDRLLQECDFEAEARNQEAFRAMWADTPWVTIPEPIRSHSARTVLTTPFQEGRRFYEFVAEASHEERSRAGEHLFAFAFGSIFGHAALHGDPHPGNYLFPRDDRVVFLDFGCVRFYEPAFVAAWKNLAWVVLDGRRADLPDAMVRTGMVPDPDRYDFDYHWDVMRYLYEPFLATRFRYTHEYVKRSWSLLGWDNPNMRRTRMPAEWVLTNRLQWGLNSVLALLEAEADFGTLFREALSTRPEAAGR